MYFKEDFKYSEITKFGQNGEIVEEYHAKVAHRLCEFIDQVTIQDGGKKNYFCICIPCYNESMDDLMKTVLCLLENIDFMKHEAKFHSDKIGKALRQEINELEIVICPVFDGCGPNQMDTSIREWLSGDMPGVLAPFPDGTRPLPVFDDPVEKGKQIEVRIAAQRWWYYCLTNTVADDDANDDSDDEENMHDNRASKMNIYSKDKNARPVTAGKYLHFHFCPIIKKANHRKHNSHHWFFEGICCGLDTNIVLLTDCATSYKTSCIARLVYGLLTRRSDVIAVTGRMRAELPSRVFHPCKNTKIPFLQCTNEHDKRGSPPCWKCYMCYYMSIAPMQGFEMEACQIINSSVYNIVEAMPVLPGPCQLMNWPKIKRYEVVEEYFDMLFHEDNVQFGAIRATTRDLPCIYKDSKFALMGHSKTRSDNDYDRVSYSEADEENGWDEFQNNSAKKRGLKIHNPVCSVAADDDDMPTAVVLTFTEFLRMHLRLAEDRILSFVSVFCTGYGTKCIQDAIFYYEPEVSFDMILKQRRRWVNGTVAGFFFFILSKRAAMHIEGGFFDKHKAGKNLGLVILLWCLNLLQFMFCFISPAIVGMSFYSAFEVMFRDINPTPSEVFMGVSAGNTLFVSHAGLATLLYLTVYVTWVIHAYYRHPSEIYAFYMFLFGLAVVLTVLLALVSAPEFAFIHYLAIFLCAGPLLLAATQTFESALYYAFYFPWFIAFAGFYLIFLPGYSFARLWDTTWGNRLTGADASLSQMKTILLKRYVKYFNIALVLGNILLTLAGMFYVQTDNARLAVIIVLFFPTGIQFTGSIFYIFVATPLKFIFDERKAELKDFEEERFMAGPVLGGNNGIVFEKVKPANRKNSVME